MANKTIPTILTNEGNVGIGISRTASLNTTTAVNGTGGGNRGFDTSFSSTTTGFTGTDATDYGYGYFAATIVAGRSYEVSATMVVTNGAPLSLITSSGLNFATQTVQGIINPPVSNTTYRFVATASATFVGLGFSRISGTMTAVVSNFSIKEVGSTLVTSDTNVGIGVASPTSLLHISGAAPTIKLQGSSSASAKVDLAGTYTTWSLENQYVNGATNDMFRIYNSALSADAITINRSTNNVGIGTTNPSSKLHIDDASTPWITISRAGVPTWQLRNNFPNNQYGFSFNNTTAGTVPLFIGAGGNIGIGLDSPAAKLDIVGTNTTIALSFGTTVPNNPLFINTYAGSMGIGMDQTTAGIRLAGDYSSAASPLVDIGYYSGGTVSHANWVNRLRVQQNGNVGIGITNPASKLHVSGVGATIMRLDAETLTSVAQFQVKANTDGVLIAGMYGPNPVAGTVFGANTSGAAFLGTTTLATVHPTLLAIGTSLTTPIIFGTNNIERMRIASAGNVGIGLTNPEATSSLHIKNLAAASKVTIESANNSESLINFSAQSSEYSIGFVRDGSNVNSFRFCAADSLSAGEVMRLQDGNVGIGTTNPLEKLHVTGYILTRSKLAYTQTHDIVKNGLSFYVDFNNKTCFDANISSTSIKDLSNNGYTLNLVNVATISNKDGNTALYTANNASYLQIVSYVIALPHTWEAWVNGDAFSSWDTIWDSNTERPLIGTFNGVLQVYPNGTNCGTLAAGKWYHIVVTTNASSVVVTYINGFQTATFAYGSTFRTGTGDYWLGGDVSAETFNGYIPIARTYNRALSATEVMQNYNIEKWRFDSSSTFYHNVADGNVGIGTVSPIGKLTVQGNIEVNYNSTTADTSVRRSFITAHATINRGANIAFGLLDGGSNPMGMTVYNVAAAAGAYNSQFITFYTHEGGVSEGEKMRITQLGDVGIGTFTPLSLLTVGAAGSTTAAKGLSFGGDASANLYRSAASTIKTDGSLEVTTSLNIGADLYVADELGVGVLIANKRVNYGAQISAASASIQLVLGRTASSTGQGAIGADSANTFAVWNVSGGFTKQLVVTQQGNVGIGADTPNAKLQIAGTTASLLTVGTLTNDWGGVAAIGTINGNGIILSKVNTSNDANRVLTIVRDDTNGASIFGYTPVGTSTSVGFQIRASASSYFNGGNVGIGESSPIQKLHVLGNTVFGNFGSETYKYNLYLSFDAVADESWVRIYLPQNYFSDNNGGTVKVRVLWMSRHASFGAHEEYQISYKTFYPSPFLTFSKIICTNKTTDFGGGTFYTASSTPDVVFYSNADDYLYIKIKGFSATYNRSRFIEAEVFGRTVATPTITTTTAPASSTELVKTIQFLPQGGNIYTAGSIGVGTTNTDPLSLSRDINLAIVTTATNAALTLVGGAAGRIDFGVGATRTAGIYSDVSNYTEIFTSTALPLVFSTNSAEKMRIKSDGNVGIGTTNPTAKLVVMGDDVQNYAKSSVPTAIIADDDVEFLIGTTDNIVGEEITLRMGSVLNTYYDKGAYIKAIQGANVDRFKLAFGTSDGATATTKMTIDNVGNVGIGTVAPTVQNNYKFLQVNGTNSAVIEAMVNNVRIGGIDSDSSSLYFGSIGSYPIVFRTAVFEKMRITAAGLVGIGTATPNTLLSVGGAGSTLPASGITFGGNSVANLYRSEADHIKTDGSFVVTNTLIVGGGQNGIRILKNGSDSISSNLYIANAANTRVFNFQQNAAGTNLALWSYNSSNTFQNLVNFNYNGSVGIGTITPSGKLHIVSTIAGETVLRTDGTNGTLFSVVDDLSDSLMSVNNSAGLPVLEVFADDRVVAGQYGSGDFVLINNKVGIGTTNPTNKLSVIGGASIGPSTYNVAAPSNGLIVEGKVGIGTTNPVSKLHVKSSLGQDGIMIDSTTYSEVAFKINGGTAKSYLSLSSVAGGYIIGSSANSLIIRNDSDIFMSANAGATSDITIKNGGNIGIGITNPAYKLDVRGQTFIYNGASNALLIQTTVADGNTRDGIYLYENDAQGTGRQAISWYNGNQNYYKARIWTEVGPSYAATTFGIDVADDARNVATRLAIRNGNVGIGRTNPSTLLSIGADGVTSAANGITFGGDAQANIYRNAEDSLATDGNFNAAGNVNSKNSRTTTYTSITSGASGNWFPLFQVNDNTDGMVKCNIRTYAHSSASFLATKGYSLSFTHSITVLNCNLNPNGGYANITGVRIRENGWVEIQLSWSSGPAVNIGVQIIGTDSTPTFAANLSPTGAVDAIADSISLSQAMFRSYGNIITASSVGISTTSPTAKVESYFSSNAITFNYLATNLNNVSPIPTYAFDVTNGVGETRSIKAGIGYERHEPNGRGTLHIYNRTTNDTSNFNGTRGSAGDIKMSINNVGNVGIGSVDASSKLDVYGGTLTVATKSSYALAVGNANTDLTFGANASNAYIQSWSSKPLYINNQGNNTIIGADVGIGNVTPVGARLHIKGDGSNPVLRVETALLVAGTTTASKTFVGWMPMQTGALSPGDTVFIPLFK